MGGGVTIGCHAQGRVVDVNNGLDGDGPFSPERSGGVPIGDLIKACFSGEYTLPEMKKLVNGHGGMVAYLGTHDIRIVEDRIENGDGRAKLVYEAMAFQIAKEIGAAATIVAGKVDGIILTGGMANSLKFTSIVKERIQFIGKVFIVPGEQEMMALAMGASRVLNGVEEVKTYQFE